MMGSAAAAARTRYLSACTRGFAAAVCSTFILSDF